jgi:signal peptidase II
MQERSFKKRIFLVAGLILLILIFDQGLKIWVKTHLTYGEEFPVFGISWLSIHFVENNGMAFGFALEGIYGKLILSIFRIIAVSFLIFFVYRLLLEKTHLKILISFSLILAGALGNILDSAFYGLLFSASNYHGGVAVFLPEGGGYAGFLQGKVVDMLYIPYFKPVFNIADIAITTGVFLIITGYKHFFQTEETTQSIEKEEMRGNLEV